jgi:hypothetical protein
MKARRVSDELQAPSLTLLVTGGSSMFAFFSLGLQELVILGIIAAVFIGGGVAIYIAVSSSNKKED